MNRPLAMRKEGIQTRKRKPKSAATSHQDKPVAGTSMMILPTMASSDPVKSRLSGIYQSMSQNGTRIIEQTDQHPVRSISSPVTLSSGNLTNQIKGIMPLDQNFSFQTLPFVGTAGHHHHYHHTLVSHPHIHSSVIHENNNSTKTDAGPQLAAVSAAASSASAASTVSHQDTASGHEKDTSPGVCNSMTPNICRPIKSALTFNGTHLLTGYFSSSFSFSFFPASRCSLDQSSCRNTSAFKCQ